MLFLKKKGVVLNPKSLLLTLKMRKDFAWLPSNTVFSHLANRGSESNTKKKGGDGVTQTPLIETHESNRVISKYFFKEKRKKKRGEKKKRDD